VLLTNFAQGYIAPAACIYLHRRIHWSRCSRML